jgi:CRP-like cAMP-binding protein
VLGAHVRSESTFAVDCRASVLDPWRLIIEPPTASLEVIVRKLERSCALTDADRRAILALPFVVRSLERGQYITREADPAAYAHLILSGWAYRQRIVGKGARQILSVHWDGDILNLSNCVLGAVDCDALAIMKCEVAMVSTLAVKQIAAEHPATIGLALWRASLADGALVGEWVTNIARRDSRTRVAHLLCEFGFRLERDGLADRNWYSIPLTQEHIADCAGLTPIHLNRVLKALEREGLIQLSRREITIISWQSLAAVGDFRGNCL